MTSHIPQELVFDILTRLPSKSLLRCQSVCKSWHSLISSDKFKLAHLKTFNLLNPRNFIRHFDALTNEEVYSVHFNDEALTMVPGSLVEFPFRYCNICTNSYLRILACVNGVLCLFHGSCEYIKDKIILWNPSIRRHLPITPAMFYSCDWRDLCLVYGFGYDKISDDFKVVRLAYHAYNYHLLSTPQVVVYSVKSGNSRIVQSSHDMPYYPTSVDSWSQVFFNGCVHWVVCDSAIGGSRSSILTFDMSTELFGEIELPDYLVNKPAFFLKASVVRGCLTVIYSSRHRFAFPGSSSYIVSVMKEYKNTASWTLMYDIQYPYDAGRVLHLKDDGGMFMGSEYGDLDIYDYNVGYWRYFYSRFVVEDAIYVDVYQESLALLDKGRKDWG